MMTYWSTDGIVRIVSRTIHPISDSAMRGPMRTSAPTVSVPMVVRYLKRSVTVACGFSVWQDDYYDHIIRGESEYLRICEYIETNPAKWQEDIYYAVPEGEFLL